MKLQPFNSSSISALAGVTIVNAQLGQILVYDTNAPNANTWKNVFPYDAIAKIVTTGSTVNDVQTLGAHKTWSVIPSGSAITIKNNTDIGFFTVSAPSTPFTGQNIIAVPKENHKEGQYIQVISGSPTSQARFNNLEVDSWRLEANGATGVKLVPVGDYNAGVQSGKINIDKKVIEFSTAPTFTFAGGDTATTAVIYAQEASGLVTIGFETGLPASGGDLTTHKVRSGPTPSKRFVGICSVASGQVSGVLSARNRKIRPLVNDCRLAIGFNYSSGGSSPWGTSGAPAAVPTVDLPRRIGRSTASPLNDPAVSIPFDVNQISNVTGYPTSGSPSGPITVTTTVPHGLTTGMKVRVTMTGSDRPLFTGGTPSVSSSATVVTTVTVSSSTSFIIDNVIGVGSTYAAGSSNGHWTLVSDTIWLLPYHGNRMMIFPAWGGDAWTEIEIPDTGISLTPLLVPNTNYDVFAVPEGGKIRLEVLAWLDNITRNAPLASIGGVLVRSLLLPNIYLGTVRSTETDQASQAMLVDSSSQRWLYNHYNRLPRRVFAEFPSSPVTWNYTSAAWRGANNAPFTITGVTTSGVVTTSATHNLVPGDLVQIVGVTGTGSLPTVINRIWSVSATTPTATTFSVADPPGMTGTYSSGGTATRIKTRVEVVQGIQEAIISLDLKGATRRNAAGQLARYLGISRDSLTSIIASSPQSNSGNAADVVPNSVSTSDQPPVGWHYYSAMEYGGANMEFYGSDPVTTVGLSGRWDC
jgi:hypothetical protein